MGQDLAGPGLAGGHRLSRQSRTDAMTSLPLVLTLWAMAAPAVSAIRDRWPKIWPRRYTNHDLISCSVLSGNRNFEGRIGPDIRANFLASPPLVVAYAIAGNLDVDLMSEPLGKGQGWQPRHPQGHLANQQGNFRPRPHGGDARNVRHALWRCVQGRRALAGCQI